MAAGHRPQHWQQRLIPAEKDGIRLWCLDPNDAAVSKYARSEPRDLRWIRAGIGASIVSLAIVRIRLKQTSFADDTEKKRAWDSFERDRERRG